MYIKTAVASVLKAVIWPSKESKNNLYLRGLLELMLGSTTQSSHGGSNEEKRERRRNERNDQDIGDAVTLRHQHRSVDLVGQAQPASAGP